MASSVSLENSFDDVKDFLNEYGKKHKMYNFLVTIDESDANKIDKAGTLIKIHKIIEEQKKKENES